MPNFNKKTKFLNSFQGAEMSAQIALHCFALLQDNTRQNKTKQNKTKQNEQTHWQKQAKEPEPGRPRGTRVSRAPPGEPGKRVHFQKMFSIPLQLQVRTP